MIIALPPSLVGAVIDTDAVVPVTDVAVTAAGASGTSAGVVVGSGEGTDVPTAFVAVTTKSTGVPFVRPVIVQPIGGVNGALTVQVWPVDA